MNYFNDDDGFYSYRVSDILFSFMPLLEFKSDQEALEGIHKRFKAYVEIKVYRELETQEDKNLHKVVKELIESKVQSAERMKAIYSIINFEFMVEPPGKSNPITAFLLK